MSISLGVQLKKVRWSKNMSLSELASLSTVDKKTLIRLEHDCSVSTNTLYKVLDALNLDLEVSNSV